MNWFFEMDAGKTIETLRKRKMTDVQPHAQKEKYLVGFARNSKPVAKMYTRPVGPIYPRFESQRS
jgi:hypothetical protein